MSKSQSTKKANAPRSKGEAASIMEVKIAPKRLDADHASLLDWYRKNHRTLPWRANSDPYRIWLSEVMLQQTTVVAVIPYYERFLQKFPKLKDLADAELPHVLEAWAGLGYYSRARNLHKAAQALHSGGFPQTAAELLELPGFGPYTSRAVASIAFNEKVGVLDGNVIRVLSRNYGLPVEWWLPKQRQVLQDISDDLAIRGEASHINQGLMELGATVCTPHNPVCLLCPWMKTCVAYQEHRVAELPLKKERKKSEVWVWKVNLQIREQKGKTLVGLIENDYAPFLKGQWLFPGEIAKEARKPKDYDARHGITHHDIYIQIQPKKSSNKNLRWVEIDELKKVNPSSLLSKTLKAALK